MDQDKLKPWQIPIVVAIVGFFLSIANLKILGWILSIGGVGLAVFNAESKSMRQLLIGAGFFILGNMIGTSFDFPINIIGLIAVAVGLIVAILSIVKKSKKKMNKSAIATVTNISETGISLSNEGERTPQVELTYEFYTDTGIRIITKETMLIDCNSLYHMQVGEKVPIRYQEDKPQNAAYDSEMQQNYYK